MTRGPKRLRQFGPFGTGANGRDKSGEIGPPNGLRLFAKGNWRKLAQLCAAYSPPLIKEREELAHFLAARQSSLFF